MDEGRYYLDFAEAFARGSLPDYVGASRDELFATARAKGLSLHKFKRKSGPPRVTRVLGALCELAPVDLLDIGSGRGAFLWPLLAHFPDTAVTAIDCLEHRVRDILAVRQGGIERLDGRLGDVTDLDFPDGSFDIVTILEVLEHLERPERAAAEVLRVARRFVVGSVPSKPDDNPEHIHLFTRDSITSLFIKAGARRVGIEFVHNHMIAVVGK